MMFWMIGLSAIIWYSYTWAVVGWMIAKFQENITSTTNIQAILKIITCFVICLVYIWMFYLALILRDRYRGIGELSMVSRNVTRVTKTVVRVN